MSAGTKKWLDLDAYMRREGVVEGDLVERFVLGGGAGGQKINKTASCVYLKHVPSGLEVKCQRSRSRDLNRYYARQELCRKLELGRIQSASQIEQAKAKIRRQKRRRSRRARARMLDDKRRQSVKKSWRRIVSDHECE